MTNKELQQLLAKLPDDWEVFKARPVQGDCENIEEFHINSYFVDPRFPHIVIL